MENIHCIDLKLNRNLAFSHVFKSRARVHGGYQCWRHSHFIFYRGSGIWTMAWLGKLFEWLKMMVLFLCAVNYGMFANAFLGEFACLICVFTTQKWYHWSKGPFTLTERESSECQSNTIARVPTRTGKPGKMGRHFSVREKLGNFEQTGKVRENHTKYWEFQTNIICHFLVIFKWPVHSLLKWIKFSVKNKTLKKILES